MGLFTDRIGNIEVTGSIRLITPVTRLTITFPYQEPSDNSPSFGYTPEELIELRQYLKDYSAADFDLCFSIPTRYEHSSAEDLNNAEYKQQQQAFANDIGQLVNSLPRIKSLYIDNPKVGLQNRFVEFANDFFEELKKTLQKNPACPRLYLVELDRQNNYGFYHDNRQEINYSHDTTNATWFERAFCVPIIGAIAKWIATRFDLCASTFNQYMEHKPNRMPGYDSYQMMTVSVGDLHAAKLLRQQTKKYYSAYDQNGTSKRNIQAYGELTDDGLYIAKQNRYLDVNYPEGYKVIYRSGFIEGLQGQKHSDVTKAAVYGQPMPESRKLQTDCSVELKLPKEKAKQLQRLIQIAKSKKNKNERLTQAKVILEETGYQGFNHS